MHEENDQPHRPALLRRTFLKLGGNADKQLSAPLPRGWDAGKVAAIALSSEKAEPFEIKIENCKVQASVPARRPVIVYRDGEKAKKRLAAG